MADKQTYAPPTSPPPNYNANKVTEHHDAGPYYPPNPSASPAPGAHNQMYPYNNNNQNDMMRAPDPAYGGYYNQGPQQGYGGPPQQGYYGQQGPPQGGFYGPGQPPQGMYYQQQPMYGQPGYYQDNRGGSGGGICAGILGAMACCCCLDMLF